MTARWLTGRRPGRILVFSGVGSLLVNFDPDKGFALEPGSTDNGWMS